MKAAPPDPLDVRAYVGRDWAALARVKADWFAAPRPAHQRIEAVDRLRAWAHALRPDLDRSALREEDLASHARVAELLRRADARTDG